MLHMVQETLKAYYISRWSILFTAFNLQKYPRAFWEINMKQKWWRFPVPGGLCLATQFWTTAQWQVISPFGQPGKDTGTGAIHYHNQKLCEGKSIGQAIVKFSSKELVAL